MDRTELPTKAHLNSLREQGIASVSGRSLRVAAAMGFGIGATLVYQKLHYSALFPTELSLKASSEWLTQLSNAFLAPIITAALAAVIAGIIQTRFLWMPGKIAPEGSRFWALGNEYRTALLARIIVGLFSTVVGICLAALLFYMLAPGILGLLNESLVHIPDWVTRVGWAAGTSVAVALIVLLVGSVAFEKVNFILKYRMTPEQKRLEQRLGEE